MVLLPNNQLGTTKFMSRPLLQQSPVTENCIVCSNDLLASVSVTKIQRPVLERSCYINLSIKTQLTIQVLVLIILGYCNYSSY